MIRVLIERLIAKGLHEEMVRVLLNVRDPEHYLVISTWLSPEAWEAWWASEVRQKSAADLMGLMIEPEVINIFEHI